MTPDPRIAEEEVERVARELFMRHMVYSGYNQETKESMFITDTLSRAYARAALEVTLSDRERAIDKAVKGEQERAAKIVRDELIDTNAEWFAKRILAAIRRPTDTESGG